LSKTWGQSEVEITLMAVGENTGGTHQPGRLQWPGWTRTRWPRPPKRRTRRGLRSCTRPRATQAQHCRLPRRPPSTPRETTWAVMGGRTWRPTWWTRRCRTMPCQRERWPVLLRRRRTGWLAVATCLVWCGAQGWWHRSSILSFCPSSPALGPVRPWNSSHFPSVILVRHLFQHWKLDS
jgi:hypothetical protein